MAYRAIIEVCELLWCLYLVVFFGMIEPARTDTGVTLRRNPGIAVSVAVLQFAVLRVTGINFFSTEEGPVGRTGITAFIAYPATTRTAVREDNGIGLPTTDHFVNLREIVIGATVDGSFLAGSTIIAVSTVCTIEPNLKELAVACHYLLELLVIVVNVFLRAVTCKVSVPR